MDAMSATLSARPSYTIRSSDDGSCNRRAMYLRRRLIVGLLCVGLFVALGAVIGVSPQTVLADRGGVPASIPAISPAAPPVAPAAAPQYLVQPGDTLWSIAERRRGTASMAVYVDRLVAANDGSAALDVGELLTLP